MYVSRNRSKTMAFCGMTAALAVVIGCLAGIIPVATYVIPVLQCMILQLVVKGCGKKLAWAWFAAVSILSVLLCPDKEAAAVFIFIGYYPIVKPRLDKLKFPVLWKLLLFSVSMRSLYLLGIYVLGLEGLSEGMTLALGLVTFALGAVTFLLLDKLLNRFGRKLS